MIVDDSAVVRAALKEIFSSDPHIEVIATANDPYIASRKLQSQVPDVMTLDIEMPRMDGITFLRKIMSQHPIPVVIISSVSERGSDNALKALEYGAIDIIKKPSLYSAQAIAESKIMLCDAVKAAALSKVRVRKVATADPIQVTPKLSADVIIPHTNAPISIQTTEKVVAVGASTGGVEALTDFLKGLPIDCPGIVIVQHMPEVFTRSFADRLNTLCKITVQEAVNGQSVLRGQALIAPGNKHMLLKRSGAKYYVEVKDGPLVNRHRPSVDVLFRSAARYAGKNTIGIIMTGMGDDGARGLLELKEAGARTIAQDEHTSVVFGMPREAIKLGAAERVLPLDQIAGQMLMWT